MKMYFLPPHPGGKGSTSVVVVCPTFRAWSPGLVLCNMGTATDWSSMRWNREAGERWGGS